MVAQKINRCTYDNTRVLELPPVTVSNACDFLLFSNAELDTGTSIEYSVTIFKNNVGGTEKIFDILPYQQYSLEEVVRYNGEVYITVTLNTTDTARTPKLNPSIQLGVGTVEANDVELYGSVLAPPFNYSDGAQYTSDYISKFFTWEPTSGKFQVYLDQYNISGTTGVQVYYDDADLMPEDEGYVGPVWVNIPFVSSTDLGNNWEEAKYESGNFSARPDTTKTRIMVIMGTNNILTRPVAGNLRANIQFI